MTLRQSTIRDVMRRAHRLAIEDLDDGWRWVCSCGQGSVKPASARGHAEGAGARHLNTAQKIVSARLEAGARMRHSA